MSTPLRLLILEDRPADAELMLNELRRSGFEPDWQRVETRAHYLAQLHQDLDVILADYALPQFDALHALHLLQESGLDIPFIIVSGRISEEVAVDCMKRGAADYLLKDRLARLGLAVIHALQEKKLRDEKRQAEAALQKSEARFRRLAENAPDAIYRYRLTPTPGFEYLSPAATAITGYTPEEYYADPDLWTELVHPDDQGTAQQRFSTRQILSQPFFIRVLRKDGATIWTEHRSVPVYDEAGNLVAIEGIARDITVRRQAEEALHLFKSIVETSNEAIAISDPEGRLVYINPAHEELFGRPLEEARQINYRDYYPPESVEVLNRDVAPALARGESWEGELDVFDVDGRRFPLWERADSVRDDEGNMIYGFGLMHDITERKRAEEALQESERRYALATSAGQVGVWDWNLETNEIYVDPNLKAILGYADHEIRNHLDDWVQCVHPDDVEQVMAAANAHLEGLAPHYEIVHRMLHKDGSIRWFLARGTAMRDVDGKPYRVLGTDTDITERKQAEEALRRSEERFRLFYEEAPLGYQALDEDGCLVEVNQVWLDTFGYSREEVIGRWFGDFLASGYQDHFKEHFTRFKAAGESHNVEFEMVRKDGSHIIVSFDGQIGYDRQGNFKQTHCILHNITERKRAEAERERLLTTLKHRNTQLQTAAEVSKSASTFLDSEKLMNQTVNLIQEHFDFYYVGVFLVDKAGEYAMLRAGTGEAGRQMLEVGHRLAVGGESMVGWSVAHAQARIALDVGEDAMHFDNPYLPQTRSEMALPLISRGRCTGALTVQSTEEAAFSEEDITVLQTMADHLAIALENARLYNAARREITERKRAEEALQESLKQVEQAKQEWESTADSLSSLVCLLDGQGRIIRANRTVEDWNLGRIVDVKGQSVHELFHPGCTDPACDLETFRLRAWEELTQGCPAEWEAEDKVLKRHLHVQVRPISAQTDEGGKKATSFAVVAVHDVTERKQADEQLKSSLKEKEMLLKEIHHRVKNNLQIISSLLKFQSEYIQDKQTLEMFQESQNRVRSMALIHEKLYQSGDLAKIDFAEYIRSMASYLFRSHEVGLGAITLKIDVGDVGLGIDTAIPCGLIIHELVSNSLKHAFPASKACSEQSESKGEIHIAFRSDEDDQFTLIVSDNGVGLPKDLDFRSTESLGLQLVNMLTQQLEGTIELDRSDGTAFKITFAEPKGKDLT